MVQSIELKLFGVYQMSISKHTVCLYTLGCKVNQYETEALSEELQRRGFEVTTSQKSPCDAYIINTCTVTAESDRKARQLIRRSITKNPAAFVIVTGCLAQTSPQMLSDIGGVDCVVGNSRKLLCADKLALLFERGEKNFECEICVDDICTAGFEQMSIDRFERTRAYIKIEDGCENRCSYCIIPTARGLVRSKEPALLLEEIRALGRGGCREVVLTGIETASYGKDLGDVRLVDILCMADKTEGIDRIRLGSLDPSLIKEDFAKKAAELKLLAPHFHLSLQSGSSRILALMRRKYNADMAMRAIELLREYIPCVNFTTDVIVGFPGETEEDFAATVDFVRRAEFLTVHIFPYSKRAGTPAAQMEEQVPENIKSRRLHELETVAADSRRIILERAVAQNKVHSVLFELYENGYALGHTPEFLEVAVPAPAPMRSEIKNVRLTHTDGKLCFGELLK